MRYFPAASLREVAAPVRDITAALTQQLILSMAKIMVAANGVGLAAPQVGESQRIILVRLDDGILALINPVLRKFSRQRVDGEEGCLSVPGVFGLVSRSVRVTVDAIAANGDMVSLTLEGFFARVVQHEVDHLNGILFIDRMRKITSGADRLRKLWQVLPSQP